MTARGTINTVKRGLAVPFVLEDFDDILLDIIDLCAG